MASAAAASTPSPRPRRRRPHPQADRHDPHRPDDGHVPRRPRPDHRRHRDPRHRRRPQGPRRAGLGHDGLPDHLDDRRRRSTASSSDIYGRKKFFIAAITIFVVGSVLCTFATSMPDAGRVPRRPGPRRRRPVLAGPGDHRRHRAAAGARASTRATSSPSSAPRASSARSSAASSPARTRILGIAGWRWVFLVNVPIGIAALVVVTRTLHLQHTRLDHRIDWWGAAALTVGLVPLLHRRRAGPRLGLGLRPLDRLLRHRRHRRRRVLPRRAGDGRRGAAAAARSSGTAPSASPRSPRSSSAWACSAASPALPLYLQIVKGASPDRGRPAAAADDPRHHDRLDRLGPDDLPHRPLPALPDHRLGAARARRCSPSTTSAPTPRCGRR